MTEPIRFTWLIPFLGVLSCLGPLSNDLYVPSLSLVAAGLDANVGTAQLTMSSTLLGFSIGCLIYGPLSDTYGRKPVLCFGLGMYVLAASASALAPSLSALVLARAFQGFGAAATMVLTRAIILDRWVGENASRALSWIAMVTFLTPVLAPVAGGYIASLGEWSIVFWVQGAAGVAGMLVTALFLPRARRAAGRRLGDSVRAYGAIASDTQALGYMLCTGLAFIGVIAFVTNSSFVLVSYFGLAPHEYGYCFSFVMLGGSLGSYVNSRYVAKLGISRMIGIGTLLLAVGGSSALIASVLDAGVPALLTSMLIYVFGVGFVFANAVARTMSRFRENAGAASSLFGVNQFLIGAIVAAALSLVIEPSPMPLGASLAAAGIAAAMVWWLWLGRPVGARQPSA